MPDDRPGSGAAPLDPALLFAPAARSGANLEADAPRLARVSFFTSRGDYEAAAAAAAALLADGVRDVRTTGAFLLGVFLQADASAIPTVLDAVVQLLGEAFASYGPAERKQVLADNTLGWLFRTLLDVLEFHNKERNGLWTRWILASDESLVEEIMAACERVRDAAKAALGAAKCTDDLTKLEVWFDVTFRQVVERQSMLPALAQVPPAAKAIEPAAKAPARPPSSVPAPAPAPAPVAPAPIPETLQLPVSPALKLLLRKLAAFETLASRGDLLKAAIVAADVRQALEAFDPKLYVPSLLASYFGELSGRIDEISPQLERVGSPSWQALEQFYLVDLDAFVAEPKALPA